MSSTVCSGGPFDTHILYKTLRIHAPSSHSICMKRLLNLSDSLISLFIVAPLVIAYWRGTWGCMDRYPSIYPATNCFILGMVIHCCCCILRELLHPKCDILRNLSRISSVGTFHVFFVKKFYTYLFSIGCIMHW